MTTHGLSGSRAYSSWCNAKSRCFNKNIPCYPNYGGRGITMCQKWRDSFEAFFRDMGECPPGHSLDRIDNDGPYSPDNCQWSGPCIQAGNKRRSTRLTFKGETHAVAEWERRLGFTDGVIKRRLLLGWDPIRALTQPPRKRLNAG